jgi:hypothetical protein
MCSVLSPFDTVTGMRLGWAFCARHGDAEHAVVERCRDVFPTDLGGKADLAEDGCGAPLATQVGCVLGRLAGAATTRDGEHTVVEGDLNVGGVEAGDRRLDNECSVSLLDVDGEAGIFDTVARRCRGRERLEQMIHLRMQIEQIVPRIPTNYCHPHVLL